ELSEYLHRHAANNVCDTPSVQNLDTKDAAAGADGNIPGAIVQRLSIEANTAGHVSGTFVDKHGAKGAQAGVDADTVGTVVQTRIIEDIKTNTAGDVPGTFVEKQGAKATDVITIEDDDDDDLREISGQATVVDLEADDAGDTHHAQHKTNKISQRGRRNGKVKPVASQPSMWHYIDPQGDEQGPFPIKHLHSWWNNGFFPNDFRVWRTGQTSDTSILLTDALRRINEVDD
ncbi:unnamed protein product, partial [Urochloa humidicola]